MIKVLRFDRSLSRKASKGGSKLVPRELINHISRSNLTIFSYPKRTIFC